MNVFEFIHDVDHIEFSNIDIWAKEKGFKTNKVYVYKDDFPNIEEVDLLLLHGGAQHLWDKDKDPWLYREVKYVNEYIERKKPVIGYCLGSQIIADAMGAEVYKAETSEIGWYEISIKKEQEKSVITDGVENSFKSFLWHADHYKLPNEFNSFAVTMLAENQIIASESYLAIGYQFHPEYTKDIIKQYCELQYEDHWFKDKTIPPKEAFLKELESLPETYELFKKLMDNSLKWFQQIRKE